MFKTLHILLACLVFLALIGCGTKGPLYIPEQRYPQGVPKQPDKGAEIAREKKDAPEANIDAPSRASP